MSAWICSDEHISFLVNYAYAEGLILRKCLEWDETTKKRAFNLLQVENVRSVRFRYGRKKDLPGSVPGFYLSELKTLQHAEAAKLAACLVYQSCEHKGWKGCAAETLCGVIQKHAESNSTAADRESAPWSI